MFDGTQTHNSHRALLCCGALQFHSLEDALRAGLHFHRSGDPASAAGIYDCILADFPGCPEACYYRALVHASYAEHDQAIALYQKVMASGPFPLSLYYDMGISLFGLGALEQAAENFQQNLRHDAGHFESWYNLGLIQQKTGRLNEAFASYQRALELSPEDFDVLFNLALVMKRLGRAGDAVRYFSEALAIVPEDYEAHYNLGLAYKEMMDGENAIRSFCRSLEINPDYAVAVNNLGIVYMEVGALDKALPCFARCIELGHRVSAAQHMLAALSGETTKSPPPDYVRSLFDQFSTTFEESLVNNLGYKTPAMLRAIFDRHGMTKGAPGKTLDLGCGTGLCGEIFRDVSDFLAGIDLSPRMVELAADKGCYDELSVGDLIEYLQNANHEFDLVVAADVLVYLGELAPLFQETGQRLKARGYFLFSTESAEEDVKLRESGRYAHSTAYIQECLGQYSFRMVHHAQENIRKERGEWIRGCLYLVQKL